MTIQEKKNFLAYQLNMKRKDEDQIWAAHTGKAFANHTKCLCDICESRRGVNFDSMMSELVDNLNKNTSLTSK